MNFTRRFSGVLMTAFHYLGALTIAAFEIYFFWQSAGDNSVLQMLLGTTGGIFAIGASLLWERGTWEHHAKYKFYAVLIAAFSVVAVASIQMNGLADYRQASGSATASGTSTDVSATIARNEARVADLRAQQAALPENAPTNFLKLDAAINQIDNENRALRAGLVTQTVKKENASRDIMGFVSFAELIGRPDWVTSITFIFYLARAVAIVVVTFQTTPRVEERQEKEMRDTGPIVRPEAVDISELGQDQVPEPEPVEEPNIPEPEPTAPEPVPFTEPIDEPDPSPVPGKDTDHDTDIPELSIDALSLPDVLIPEPPVIADPGPRIRRPRHRPDINYDAPPFQGLIPLD